MENEEAEFRLPKPVYILHMLLWAFSSAGEDILSLELSSLLLSSLIRLEDFQV